jgi:acyl-CoA thioesterase YciA
MNGCEIPQGEMMSRTLCMPKDKNPSGDIFGGWLLCEMDNASYMLACREAGGRTVTIAVDAMEFHLPVSVGDTLSCYALVKKIGRTSIAIHVEAWVQRQYESCSTKATEGTCTFVAVDADRKPRAIDKS